jgi:nucleoside-diphosphate-sugar epimerase
MKKILVCGAGGFIGSHLVKRLTEEGNLVRGVDLKYPDYWRTFANDSFIKGDLRDPKVVSIVLDDTIDEVYQLAADMGGAGFCFTGENDADILHNSALINLNIAKQCVESKVDRVFYSSSACIYPERNQLDPNNPNCVESSAYPADPDSEYGWEKLFSERLYLAFARNYGLNVRIARYHNIYGPNGTWDGGREKAPAAICRKVAKSKDGDTIDIWGSGKQTRSFLYVDECVEGTIRLMNSDFAEPVNLGSDRMISILDFTKMIIDISGKNLSINHIEGPQGVAGRNSENTLIKEKLGWSPQNNLEYGIKKTYDWISSQVNK